MRYQIENKEVEFELTRGYLVNDRLELISYKEMDIQKMIDKEIKICKDKGQI